MFSLSLKMSEICILLEKKHSKTLLYYVVTIMYYVYAKLLTSETSDQNIIIFSYSGK